MEQVRTERGVLPAEHPQRADTRLAAAVAALERDNQDEAATLISAYMSDEEERILRVPSSSYS